MNIKTIFMISSLVLGAYHLGSGAYFFVKAELGQFLISQAWANVTEGDIQAKPWPWADTYPVAQLDFEFDQEESLYVLAGTSGKNLAWAPTLLLAGSRPGDTGNTIISAHRDTHFAVLQNAAIGDEVTVTTHAGTHVYVIQNMAVVDSRTAFLEVDTDIEMLTLVTCYPFAALNPGGPLRYVVTAEPKEAAQLALKQGTLAF